MTSFKSKPPRGIGGIMVVIQKLGKCGGVAYCRAIKLVGEEIEYRFPRESERARNTWFLARPIYTKPARAVMGGRNSIQIVHE